MSQKNSKKRKQSMPRAMPVETIITRYKSAQQKSQQERNQKKSTKSKVHMRKSKKTNRTPVSIKGALECLVKEKPIKLIQELKEIDTNEEYYPKKLRRPLLNKKVVLAPKHNYKLVGDLNAFNKRKLKKPTKEIVNPQRGTFFNCSLNEEEPDSLNESELSIVDMISIQDSDSLDDEDLLEILTCPSPVWWEDPPDGYDEDPLPAKTQDVDNEIKQQKVNSNEIVKDQNKLNPLSAKTQHVDTINEIKQQKVNSNEIVKDQNKLIKIFTQGEQNDLTISNALPTNANIKENKIFINRRNKLETLLGNLRNKKMNSIEPNEENSICNNSNKKMNTTESNKEIENSTYNSTTSSLVWERHKRTSESCDEEVLDGNYDEILKTFESIDIPIKNTSNDKETNSMEKAENAVNVLKFDTGIMSPCFKVTPVKGLTIKKCDIRTFKPNKKNVMMTNKIEQNMTANKKNKMLYLKSLSGYCNTKIVKKINKNKEINKTETMRSLNKAHYLPPVKGLTIKNWDIHLLNRSNKKLEIKNTKKIKTKGENKKDEVIDGTSGKVIIQNNNETKSEGANTNDYVTVYNIISEQENKNGKKNTVPKLELNNEYNTQLNLYYNQCKNINKNKKEIDNVKNNQLTSDGESDVNSPSIKSISVSDNETVKYCLQCSSIFDTDICKYCDNKFNSNCTRQSDLNIEHLQNVQHNEKL